MSNPKMFKYEWVWEKSVAFGFVHAKNQPMKKHENVLVFSKAPMGHKSLLGDKRMKYEPSGIVESGKKIVLKKPNTLGQRPNQEGKEYMSMTGFPTSIIKFNNDKGLHPTQKPVALFEYLIKTYTNEGDTVLDNCAGSGTTAIACLQTKRNYILMEKEESYFQVIQKRIANFLPPLI
jgi:site-specific DNA-methyltransferase (adenine-specific)